MINWKLHKYMQLCRFINIFYNFAEILRTEIKKQIKNEKTVNWIRIIN